MAAVGWNPHTAIAIAFAGEAVDTVRQSELPITDEDE